jgi:ABC-type antimicrobial peptide transport system permease subunit
MGVYGLMSYAVARRRSEIGIRLGLGATRARVMAMILKDSMVLVSIGVAFGVPAALAGSRIFRSVLFGLNTTSFSSVGGAACAMALAGMVATLAPAWRASKVDPMVALRHS